MPWKETCVRDERMVRPAGFEPATFGSGVRWSRTLTPCIYLICQGVNIIWLKLADIGWFAVFVGTVWAQFNGVNPSVETILDRHTCRWLSAT